MTRAKKTPHPTQSAVPEIDRGAEVLTPEPAPEALMPTTENEPPCLFVPGNGITTTDVLEIALMYLLQMTNTNVTVAPGALRMQQLQANRVASLSEAARRWMKPVQLAPEPPAA